MLNCSFAKHGSRKFGLVLKVLLKFYMNYSASLTIWINPQYKRSFKRIFVWSWCEESGKKAFFTKPLTFYLLPRLHIFGNRTGFGVWGLWLENDPRARLELYGCPIYKTPQRCFISQFVTRDQISSFTHPKP